MKSLISNLAFTAGMLIFGAIMYHNGYEAASNVEMPSIQEYKSTKELQS